MSCVIRAAGREDARAVAEVHLACWQGAYRGLLPQRYLDGMHIDALERRWLQRIRRPVGAGDRGSNIWIAKVHGRVVAFALIGPCIDDDSLIGFAGEVCMLYVHPGHARRGIGRTLLAHALDLLAGRSYYWCVIWVLEGNRPAREFYEGMGFRPDGARRRDRFSGEDVSVVRYARSLNPVLDGERFGRRPSSRA